MYDLHPSVRCEFSRVFRAMYWVFVSVWTRDEVFQVVGLPLRLVLSNAPGEPDQRLNNVSLQLFIQFMHTVCNIPDWRVGEVRKRKVQVKTKRPHGLLVRPGKPGGY